MLITVHKKTGHADYFIPREKVKFFIRKHIPPDTYFTIHGPDYDRNYKTPEAWNNETQ
jgi:hypothetical protein